MADPARVEFAVLRFSDLPDQVGVEIRWPDVGRRLQILVPLADFARALTGTGGVEGVAHEKTFRVRHKPYRRPCDP